MRSQRDGASFFIAPRHVMVQLGADPQLPDLETPNAAPRSPTLPVDPSSTWAPTSPACGATSSRRRVNRTAEDDLLRASARSTVRAPNDRGHGSWCESRSRLLVCPVGPTHNASRGPAPRLAINTLISAVTASDTTPGTQPTWFDATRKPLKYLKFSVSESAGQRDDVAVATAGSRTTLATRVAAERARHISTTGDAASRRVVPRASVKSGAESA